MTPQQLKNSILQQAIEGKLVEQRPEEGTGEELYQQIQKEKQKLIKEGKIKKEKPLPPITEEEIPFEIPKSWKWVHTGDIGSWRSGATPSKNHSKYYGGNIPWLITGDLNDGIISEISGRITKEALKETSVHLNPAGSVLMAMYGATIGKLGILAIDATTNQACCACQPFDGVFNKYLFYYLLARRKYFTEQGSGSGQPNISKQKIINSVFALPPLAEQKRIVAKIEELQTYLDQYEQAYNHLENFNKRFPDDMKKSILQMAIEGKLVEQRPEEGTGEELYQQIQKEKQELIKEGKIKKEKTLPLITKDEIPFEIPKSWKWVRIGKIFTLQAGKNVPTGHIHAVKDDDNKYLCYGGNGIRGYIDTYNRNGDYALIGRQGALCGNVNLAHGKFYATEHAVVVDNYNQCDTNWNVFFLRALNLNQYATATAQPGLAVSTINKVLIPLPPLAEQKRIVAKIEELLPLCDQLK